ncbi:anti-sigma-L factor RslA [Pilimelia anulata]|uniref:Anti-sigma-L factor RslA n=1 Tax=Pilimelia anulata TaxID=53371 RepID=A0A8J3B4T3_9ACTN|nr:zf-HC2 domain-containing protein [Pilimelia anulata]GGJ95614.1 anti-sigma-L factor RslA [Pilimelia anulata]
MRCEFEHSDASYVLGALSPAERDEYEHHLEGCPECREAVAEIAVLPGLLSRLDPLTAEELLGAGLPTIPAPRASVDPLPPVAARPVSPRPLARPAATAVRRPPRRPRMRYVVGGLAASGIAAVVGFATLLPLGAPAPVAGPTPAATGNGQRNGIPTGAAPRLVPMVPVSRSIPMKAEIGLSRHGYGTAVRMHCRYADAGAGAPTWTVSLIAYGPNDQREQVGSWVAEPGGQVAFDGVTRFSGDQLERLEVVRSDTGEKLIWYAVPR